MEYKKEVYNTIFFHSPKLQSRYCSISISTAVSIIASGTHNKTVHNIKLTLRWKLGYDAES